MRKTWMEPQIEVQQFTSNEYVAACGDTNRVYKFICDAGDLGLKNYPYNVYTEDGRYISNFHACGATHEAPTDGDFRLGYMDDTRTQVNDRIPVVIWLEPQGWFGTDTHCTSALDMDEWETDKS